LAQKILVIHYSQSGQLTDIIKSIIGPLQKSADVEMVWENLQPCEPFPFPWSPLSFFDVFPESVLLEAPGMNPFLFDSDAPYDLIILGYTVWYLSPSPPVVAFLKSAQANVMKDVPVITVVNCKDRWLMAQETVKEYIHKAGGKLIDNVVFVHQGNEITSLVSTLRWLLTGKKNGFWRIFPPAGVDKKEIEGAAKFGEAILEALQNKDIKTGKSLLRGMGAVKVNPNIIQQEKVGYRNFVVWARIVRAFGKRGQWRRLPCLFVFIFYLGVLVSLSVPFALIIRVLVNPFRKDAIRKEIEYFEQPSGD